MGDNSLIYSHLRIMDSSVEDLAGLPAVRRRSVQKRKALSHDLHIGIKQNCMERSCIIKAPIKDRKGRVSICIGVDSDPEGTA